MKRDVVGAAMWVSFKALVAGGKPPKEVYVVPYRPQETMYVVPSDDIVIVVYSIAFENKVEQAIAKTFLQEIVISRKQSRDLMTAPSVTYTHEPPHELKTIKELAGKLAEDSKQKDFIGYVSLAVSKRNVEGGRLEKAVTLAEGYRSFLHYHVQVRARSRVQPVRTPAPDCTRALTTLRSRFPTAPAGDEIAGAYAHPAALIELAAGA
jgi:actin related protein 2/3 complex subunit 2